MRFPGLRPSEAAVLAIAVLNGEYRILSANARTAVEAVEADGPITLDYMSNVPFHPSVRVSIEFARIRKASKQLAKCLDRNSVVSETANDDFRVRAFRSRDSAEDADIPLRDEKLALEPNVFGNQHIGGNSEDPAGNPEIAKFASCKAKSESGLCDVVFRLAGWPRYQVVVGEGEAPTDGDFIEGGELALNSSGFV